MAAFPLYSPLICPLGWEPTFDAGSESCVIQTGDVTRSRLTAGGTFFRSVESAATFPVNNITLDCVVVLTGNEGIDTDVYSVDFSITDPVNGTIAIPTFTQKFDNDASSCTLEGPQQLRDLLAGSPAPYVVTMPDIDNPAGWNSASDTCLLTSFSLTMSGGIGLPAYSSSLRTGPTFALFHVANADTAENGDNEVVDAISEWDGVNNQWIAHPSTLYEVGEPAPCP